MRRTFQFQSDERAAGQRLDEFLWARLTQFSRMHIAKLIWLERCAVNGETAHAGRKLNASDVINITLDEDAPTAMTPEPLPLEIIHEDEHLIVVVKPAGTLMHPTRGVKNGTLANALAYHLNRPLFDSNRAAIIKDENAVTLLHKNMMTIDDENAATFHDKTASLDYVVRPGIVHRLDRATSGLVVVAKTQRALSALSRQFHKRIVSKRYFAIVDGRIEDDFLNVCAPIGRREDAQPFWRVTAEGKHAETNLRVSKRSDARTLVALEPVTGRTNQLRIHCAHIGHPIVGDEWYGGGAFRRLCLHAAQLSFRHPANGERMTFDSPAPPEMIEAFK